MVLMFGKELAEIIKDDLRKEIKIKKIKLFLAVLLIGKNEASLKYVDIKKKECVKIGIGFKLFKLNEKVTQEKVLSLINKLNADKSITGILVQVPIPAKFDRDKILQAISPEKDVDGLNAVNQGKLMNNIDGLCPATPEGIINLLRYYQVPLVSKRVIVVGKSNLVGKPLALMLLREKATVTIANSKTRNLKELTLGSDIVISATGHPKLIKKDMLKNDAVVINVGAKLVDGKMIGDVDFENVSKRTSFITPNFGGVGPMTVAMLLSNILKAYKLTNKKE